MSDGMESASWEISKLEVTLLRTERQRDEAQEEVAASLGALVDLQIKYDEANDRQNRMFVCCFLVGVIFAMAFGYWVFI